MALGASLGMPQICNYMSHDEVSRTSASSQARQQAARLHYTVVQLNRDVSATADLTKRDRPRRDIIAPTAALCMNMIQSGRGGWTAGSLRQWCDVMHGSSLDIWNVTAWVQCAAA